MFGSVISLFFAVLAFSSLVIATPAAKHLTSRGALPHPAGDMLFSGNFNGRDLQLKGSSAQEIFDQIKILHPEFNPNFTSPEEFPALQARQYTPREPHQPIGIPECVPIGTWGWSACLSQAIFNNNVYLQTLDGGVANCGVGAGPATCVRIACQQQAAIWLCNDNDYPLTLRCWDMAYYSLGIINYCPFTIYNGDLYCGGQWFDERKFNIIVRWDNDNCGVGPPTTTARV